MLVCLKLTSPLPWYVHSGNPAIMPQAAKCFTTIAQALEAETLQGQTAQRIVAAAKVLITSAGLDADQLLATLPPETQQTLRTLFG